VQSYGDHCWRPPWRRACDGRRRHRRNGTGSRRLKNQLHRGLDHHAVSRARTQSLALVVVWVRHPPLMVLRTLLPTKWGLRTAVRTHRDTRSARKTAGKFAPGTPNLQARRSRALGKPRASRPGRGHSRTVLALTVHANQRRWASGHCGKETCVSHQRRPCHRLVFPARRLVDEGSAGVSLAIVPPSARSRRRSGRLPQRWGCQLRAATSHERSGNSSTATTTGWPEI
jgi:hypothetical protein